MPSNIIGRCTQSAFELTADAPPMGHAVTIRNSRWQIRWLRDVPGVRDGGTGQGPYQRNTKMCIRFVGPQCDFRSIPFPKRMFFVGWWGVWPGWMSRPREEEDGLRGGVSSVARAGGDCQEPEHRAAVWSGQRPAYSLLQPPHGCAWPRGGGGGGLKRGPAAHVL